MLYTARPLERIYAPPEVFNHNKNVNNGAEDSSIEYKEVILPSGRIVTRRDGENYIIERINSTDMSDYLNTEYSPGKSYQSKSKR